MKLVFFGTPAFAVPALEHLIGSRHRLAGVVTQPDRPRDRGLKRADGPIKRLALRYDLPVLQPERLKDDAFVGQLTAFDADLGVVAAYGKILPERVLAIPRLGLINVHASLLPRYRGAAPVQRAVMAGEQQTGVSIMRIVRELDAGPIFATRALEIGPDESSDRVEQRLAQAGAVLLLEVIDDIEAGSARETPQDDRLATYAPRIAKDEGLIDWTTPARTIHDKIRGLHPWPHAHTHLGHTRYIVLESAVGSGEPPASGTPGITRAPGEILEAAHGVLAVASGSGTWLKILRIQLEGRRPMTTREFLAGHSLSPGMAFGSP